MHRATFETRSRARHRSARECVDIEGVEWKKPEDSGWWMAEGHRSLGRNGEREEMETVRSGPSGWVIQSALMREKRKIKQPSVISKMCAHVEKAPCRTYWLPLIKIDECEVEWSTLDIIWVIAVLSSALRLLTVRCEIIECFKYGGIILRNILKFAVKYYVKSTYAFINSRFAPLRDLNEKSLLADQLGRCFFF